MMDPSIEVKEVSVYIIINLLSNLFPLQWIPALKDGRLNLGEFALPVAADKLPQSYSMLAPDVQLPNMKWVDGHKPVFSCSLHTESSVHPQVSVFVLITFFSET